MLELLPKLAGDVEDPKLATLSSIQHNYLLKDANTPPTQPQLPSTDTNNHHE